jgi:hypothetical protein
MIFTFFMNINTTPVPNALFDNHLKGLHLAELKVLLVIIRQTLGWEDKKTKNGRKDLDWISNSQLVQKTGCSPRAINVAVQQLVIKDLIRVLSIKGELLDSPEKRRGQPKLYFRVSSAIKEHVENRGKSGEDPVDIVSPCADYHHDLRKLLTGVTQKMRITKETLQN